MESPRISEPSAKAERARLFFALDPDDATREALTGWREEALGDRPELRLPPPQTLHVTLAFLGSRPGAEIPEVARTGLSSVAGLGAPVLGARGVVAVPRRRPRLVALDLDDTRGRARELAAAVSSTLAAERLHEPEDRPFWAHLTLARMRGRPARAGNAGVQLARRPPGSLTFDHVTLYRSLSSPSGARYEPIERRRLVTAG